MTSLKVVKVRTPAEEDIDEDGQQYELQRQNCSDFLLVWASPIATAFANFGVQYNYDSIGAANTWLHKEHGSFTKYDTLASNMIFVGTLIGMIGFGIAGDLVGRNLGLMLCMAIQVLFGLLQGLVTWGDSTAVWILLIFMRMMIGVGAGGVYPLSAAKATEDCTNVDPAVKAKGASWAFFWRNPGAMMVWFNVLIMYASIGSGINDAPKSVNEGWDWSWRYILVFGAVAPAFCALFMHMQPAKVVETSKTRISQWNERRISRASRASAVSPPSLSSARSGATASTGTASTGLWLDIKDDPGVWWKFLGTAGGWFFFDWAFYGNHLMQPRILGLIMPSTDTPVRAHSRDPCSRGLSAGGSDAKLPLLPSPSLLPPCLPACPPPYLCVLPLLPCLPASPTRLAPARSLPRPASSALYTGQGLPKHWRRLRWNPLHSRHHPPPDVQRRAVDAGMGLHAHHDHVSGARPRVEGPKRE